MPKTHAIQARNGILQALLNGVNVGKTCYILRDKNSTMNEQATRKRLTNVIFAAQSMLSAGQIAIITLMSIVAVELSGTETLAGLPSTTLTLAQAFTALPIGVIMGRMGRRFGLGVSYSASVLGAILGIFSVIYGLFWLLLVSSVFIGAGRAGAEQSRFAVGDMFTGGERARMMGRIVFAGTVGAIVGPLLVGPSSRVAEMLGLPANTGAWIAAVLLYGVAVLLIFAMLYPDPQQLTPEAQAAKQPNATPAPQAPTRSIWELLRLPSVRLALLALLISQTVMVALMVITPVHMSHHNHGNDAISLVITLHTLGMFAFSGWTGSLIERHGVVKIMFAGAVILIVSAIISPLSPTMPVLLLGLFLLGLGWNFGYLAGSALLSESLIGQERNKMQGTSDMLVAGSAALGSFSSGPVFGIGGYVGVAIMGGVLTLLLVWSILLWGAASAQQMQPITEPQNAA